MDDMQVPVQEETHQDNEFFQQINERKDQYFDISPMKHSAYSVRPSSAKRKSFEEDVEQGNQLLKMIQEKQADNRVHNFLQNIQGQAPEPSQQGESLLQQYNKVRNERGHEGPRRIDNQHPPEIKTNQQGSYSFQVSQVQFQPQQQQPQPPQIPQTPSQPTGLPFQLPPQLQQQFLMHQQQLQQQQQQQLQSSPQFPTQQSQVVANQSITPSQFQLLQSQLLMQQQQQAQLSRSQEGQGGEKCSNEIYQMQQQIISFYDKNLNNLKNIILQKDQEIQTKDDKLREMASLIHQMKQSFTLISQKYEAENQELMRRYMGVMEAYSVKSLDDEQRHEREQIMIEFVQLKQSHVELNSSKMNLEIRVRDLEIKHQSDQLRLNDQRMKIEYLQNELNDIQTAKGLIEQQNMQLLQQLDQIKMQHQQEIHRIFSQQEHLQHQNHMQHQQLLQQQQQISQINLQHTSQTYLQQQQSTSALLAQYQLTQLQSQPNLQKAQPFNQMPHNQLHNQPHNQPPPQQHYQQPQTLETTRSQPKLQTHNQQGILSFPSDQRYYNQMDEMNALHKDLQEAGQRKQQLESELNKRSTGVKGISEKRRREQLENEMEEVIDQINKIKLKLREFKM